MNKPSSILQIAALCAVPWLTAHAASPTKTPADNPVLAERNETPAQHDARMAWWREAKFGMFIHWGLYSIPEGVWKDKVHATGYS